MIKLDRKTKGALSLILCFAIVVGTLAGFSSDPMKMWPLLFWTGAMVFVSFSIYDSSFRTRDARSDPYEVTFESLVVKKGVRVMKIDPSEISRVVRPLFAGSEVPEEIVLALNDGRRVSLPYSTNLERFLKKLPKEVPVAVGWTPLDRRWALASAALILPLVGLGAAQKITFMLDALR